MKSMRNYEEDYASKEDDDDGSNGGTTAIASINGEEDDDDMKQFENWCKKKARDRTMEDQIKAEKEQPHKLIFEYHVFDDILSDIRGSVDTAAAAAAAECGRVCDDSARTNGIGITNATTTENREQRRKRKKRKTKVFEREEEEEDDSNEEMLYSDSNEEMLYSDNKEDDKAALLNRTYTTEKSTNLKTAEEEEERERERERGLASRAKDKAKDMNLQSLMSNVRGKLDTEVTEQQQFTDWLGQAVEEGEASTSSSTVANGVPPGMTTQEQAAKDLEKMEGRVGGKRRKRTKRKRKRKKKTRRKSKRKKKTRKRIKRKKRTRRK
jgi:hypothetical protein